MPDVRALYVLNGPDRLGVLALLTRSGRSLFTKRPIRSKRSLRSRGLSARFARCGRGAQHRSRKLKAHDASSACSARAAVGTYVHIALAAITLFMSLDVPVVLVVHRQQPSRTGPEGFILPEAAASSSLYRRRCRRGILITPSSLSSCRRL